MNKQQLASKIWESANKMRSKIEASDYKDFILGFIFYKYLSEKEENYLKDQGFTQEDIEKLSEEDKDSVQFLQRNVGYFIAYSDLFSTWIKKGKDFDVSNVTDALSAFSRLISPSHRNVFDKIFTTLQTGLIKLGESSASRTKAISDLIQLIKDIPMDGKQDYDVLGFIYEYLIGMFAANAGKKAGEFYTPHEVSLIMSEIVANHLKDRDEIKIYDPTSGSGSLLINIGKSAAKHMADKNKIMYYAQEIKEPTYNLTRMNLVMRGILPNNIVVRNGDTLAEDWPFFDENHAYSPLYVDAVVSNPPYSLQWDPENKEEDPRFSSYGLAPKSKADYAFLLHDLFHIKPDGIVTIVLPHGVLFRGNEEGQIRKNLIEGNHIDAIIGLPANIFFGTGIPTIIMVLKQKRDNTDVLIIDASKGFEKVGKNNKLRSSDIKKIVDTVSLRSDIAKYSRKVSREEIRKNDYNLNIPRYVDSSDDPETFDLLATMRGGIPNYEIDGLNSYFNEIPGLREDLFQPINSDYSSLKTEDIEKAVEECPGVKTFKSKFSQAFADLPSYLKKELIENVSSVNSAQEESVISDHISSEIAFTKLVDRYDAYQILDDEWKTISVDLELIQTEGFAATKQVDPNMVLKKKDGKDVEIQEGYIGHVIPFDLVKREAFPQELKALSDKEERLSEIDGSVQEVMDSFTDEEKGLSFFPQDGDGYLPKDLATYVKPLFKNKSSYDPESSEGKALLLYSLDEKQKSLKREIKAESERLEGQAKTYIEKMTDDQALALLEKKWISPLVSSFEAMSSAVLESLESKIKNLTKKYDIGLSTLEKQIEESEKDLSKMIDDLSGDQNDLDALKDLKNLLDGGKND